MRVRFASLVLTLVFSLEARAALTVPEIVFPAASSGEEVFRGSFSPDGTVFYFFRKTKTDPEKYRIFSSRLAGGAWSAPEPVLLGDDHSNTYPAISPDGRYLVFASSRRAPGMKGEPNYYLWQVERSGSGWGAPRFLEALNLEGHYHSWPSFGPDGRLYFRRTTPDWRTNTSLVVDLDAPDRAPQVDPIVERCSAARPDLRIVGGLPGPRNDLYFLDVAIPRTGGAPAHSDIWVCEPDGGEWKPRPLSPAINTADWETFPFFSRDGRDLYFVRGFRTFHRIDLDATLSPAAPCEADRAALLALHEKVMRAHREGDVDMLFEDGVDDSIIASRGAVARPDLEEMRARLGPYLSSTRFEVYRDRIAPIVRVSDDGSLGWVVVEIEAKGTQRASDGTEAPLEFISAWIELYEKRDGRWYRVGNVSNFKP